MSAEAWGFLGISVTAIATLVGGLGVAWIQFARRTSRVEDATRELKPNGGSTLADAIRRMEVAQERAAVRLEAQTEVLSTQLAELRGAFLQHCKENKGRSE